MIEVVAVERQTIGPEWEKVAIHMSTDDGYRVVRYISDRETMPEGEDSFSQWLESLLSRLHVEDTP